MRRWIKRALLGAMGASVVLGTLTACSHQPHSGGVEARAERAAHIRQKVVSRVVHRLELTAPQQQKLNVLADKVEAQRAALNGDADPRARMQSIVAGAKFDRAAAQSLWDEKALALQTMSPEVLAALADFYDSLDPAQQQKVRDALARRKGWLGRV